jgi:hypothetical protein
MLEPLPEYSRELMRVCRQYFSGLRFPHVFLSVCGGRKLSVALSFAFTAIVYERGK